jgi:hypothetical protein
MVYANCKLEIAIFLRNSIELFKAINWYLCDRIYLIYHNEQGKIKTSFVDKFKSIGLCNYVSKQAVQTLDKENPWWVSGHTFSMPIDQME